MEAIMKAFQKMEEREQRRKEAAAHQHHTHEIPKEVTPAPTGKAAARTKSGKSKSVDESKLKDSGSSKLAKESASGKSAQSSTGKVSQAPAAKAPAAVKVKEEVKAEPAAAVSSPPAREKSPEVQVRTLRSNTMPRTKAASKAMPPGLIMDTSQFNSLPPPQLEAIKVFC